MARLTARRKSLFICISFLLPLVAGAIAAELYIRWTSVYGYLTPATIRASSPDYQPAVFARHVLQPKAKSIVIKGEEKFRINALGYRGRDFTAEKPAGMTRVMVYGGSSVFDAESPGDDDWPHRVERLLHDDGLQSVEVINAGIPGLSSSESVGTLFSEGHLFSPDYILLYAQWNDIKLFTSKSSILREFTRQPVQDDPRITYQNGVDRLLSNTSQLYVRVRARYYTWKLNIGAEGVKPERAYSSIIEESGLKQYRLNIETFVDIARNIGAEPILMIEARLVAPDNTPEEKKRILYDYVLLTHEALCKAFDAQDQIIYDVARRKGVRVIDSTRELIGEDAMFVDHIHLSPEGSKELATRVARDLGRILRVPHDP